MATRIFDPNKSYYEIHLYGTSAGQKIDVTAWVPEQFQMQISSDFEAKFGGGRGSAIDAASRIPILGGLVGAVGNNVIRPALDVTGYSDVLQILTLQNWVSTSPIEFSLPLIFIAHASARDEVTEKIKVLMMAGAPRKTSSGFLVGPGPSLAGLIGENFGIESSKDFLSFRIGKTIFLPMVIIKSVNVTIDSMFNADGNPIEAQIDVTLSTVTSPIKDDIDKMFISSATSDFDTNNTAESARIARDRAISSLIPGPLNTAQGRESFANSVNGAVQSTREVFGLE